MTGRTGIELYRCLDCGWDFDDPINHREHTGVKADGGFQETVYLSVCPYCHSSNHIILVTCSECGTEYPAGQKCPTCEAGVRGKFRDFLYGLSKYERNILDDLLDGNSVEEV